MKTSKMQYITNLADKNLARCKPD